MNALMQYLKRKRLVTKVGGEGHNLAPPQLTPDDRLSRSIDGMDLENALRDIDTDRDNFIHRTAPVPRG